MNPCTATDCRLLSSIALPGGLKAESEFVLVAVLWLD